ncbi:alpha/beta fold hydrolase [Smaragdicoccus niigatensis]|uniref:alpha/beta fold hydrolase n=1 Tax=Smaragdicoccus niigatensis TaxID=359359 RepID=UPI00037CDBA4|nr:alpha/beta fold hydrolase [Smaragdicoccus niigatensis]
MSTTHYVTGANGISLRAREWGNPANPTVLLVHGYPDNSSVWDDVVPQLATNFHVVTYDVRGAGASQPGEQFGGYRFPLLVQDLGSVIDQVVPDDRKVHLVAHDWGAIQSWEAVLDQTVSERIASYTYFGAPALDHAMHWIRSRVRPNPGHLAELAQQLVKSWYIYLFHLPVVAPLAWNNGFDKIVPHFMAFADKQPVRPSDDMFAADGRRGVGLYRANFIPKLLKPGEGRTEIPVQAVITDGDWFVNPKLFAETTKRVTNLYRRDLQAGHWISRSHPDQIATWVTEFVRFIANGEETDSIRNARAAAIAG